MPVLDQFRGIVTFNIYTDNPEDFVNRLRNSSIAARNISVSDGTLSGEIYWFDEKPLKRLADKYHAGFEETGRKGFIFTVVRYRRRYGLFAGIFAAVVMVFLLSNITMKINIYGNVTMSDEEVRAVLDDCGIRIGSYLPGVNLRSAERDIVADVDGVAWAGIKRQGPIVSVEISEMTGKPEMIPTNMPCNVVSTKNAQIVKIKNVPMGQLKPMLYDTVKKGDLLVSGVIEGKLHNTYYVHAMAEIVGRYEEKISFTQALSDTELRYGNVTDYRSLWILGLRIPLYPGKLRTGNAEIEETINYINLFSLELPVGIVHTELRPYTETECTYTPDEAREKLIEKLSRYEQNFFSDEDVAIISREADFTAVDGGVRITAKYVLESDICETDIIMVKNHK
jgi:similar to stage IV sporulation protein